MTNPNPLRITGPVYRLWTDRPETSWRLGGIFADKPGYHSSVNHNLSKWPNNYSVRFRLDTQRGPQDKARAIDYTMSDADMRKYTARLVAAADRNDPRMRGVREFYGTLNSSTVVGRIRDNDTESYRSSSADSSHLWHIHISIWAAYCNDWSVLSGIISILRGESLAQWKREEGGLMALPRKGDGASNEMQEEVEVIQRILVALGYDTVPPGGKSDWRYDGEYGDGTESAVRRFRADNGINNPSGARVTPWTFYIMLRRLGALDNASVDIGQVKDVAISWLDEHRDELRGEDGRDGVDGIDGKTPRTVVLSVEGTVTEVE